MYLGKDNMASKTGSYKKTDLLLWNPCQEHGILAKIMVSLGTILHGHRILANIMTRSWQGQQGTCHESWQGYHGFKQWVAKKLSTLSVFSF